MIEACEILAGMESFCTVWLFLLSSEQEPRTINFMFYIRKSPNIVSTVSSLITVWNQAVNNQKEVALQTVHYQANNDVAKVFFEH